MSRQQLLDDPDAAVPQAAQFLAGYFHQDWVVDSDTWESVVDDFAVESPRAVVTGCATDLRTVLAAGLDDDDLTALLDRVGGSVDPAAFGMSPREWLTAVAARLEQAS